MASSPSSSQPAPNVDVVVTSASSTGKTTWSEDHDLMFLREVLVSDLFMYRKSSVERGKVWDDIADKLNALESPCFNTNARYLIDKLNKLKKWFTKKNGDELWTSGIDPEDDEKSELVEEVIGKMESTSPINPAKAKKVEEDKQTADKIRRKAMETVGTTNKRTNEGDKEKRVKNRRSGNEVVEFLKEKTQLDHEMRKAEVEAKKRNEEFVAKQTEQQQQFQGSLLHARQQEQQQQQNLIMMQQQQAILTYLQQLKN